MSSTKFDSDSLGTEGEKVNPEQPSIRRNKGDADETCAEKVKIIREDVMPEKSLEFQVLGNHGQAMTVAIDGSTFVGSRLPFLQQWQTDKYCQLKHLQFHPLFPSSHPSPVNELVSWLENDDRLEKVWDAEMHERSILRDYEFSDMRVHSIYSITRNFEVDVEHGSDEDKLGRNGILFVPHKEEKISLDFLTCRAGATVKESLTRYDVEGNWRCTYFEEDDDEFFLPRENFHF